MGQRETFLFALALLVLSINPKEFVKSQRILSIDPTDEFTFIRGVPSTKGQSILSQSQTIIQQARTLRQEIQDDQTLEWRLQREVIPTEYHVKITPILDEGHEEVGKQWDTPGEVSITVQAQRATTKIVLHSKNITIHDIKVTQGASEITVHNVTTGEYDFLNINLDSTLQQGQTYVVYFNFTSWITTELNGLYRSSYIDPDTGNRTWLATTQMEALHARQLMPCFDEPALKSIFHFTIGRLEKYVTLFNTKIVSNFTQPELPGWIYETFAPTVKQSTYLLALIVSEFKYEEAPPEILPGKRVRTYAPDHYIREKGGVYAAENAAKVLAFFGNYFSHEYPLNKMDSAAVPDFYFGAMENYGLNIYRETALLVFPGVTLESERWSITSVIAHELAHQWFGNLVSPAWWTHIWLNEGFATYFASVGSENTNPEFESRKRFLNDAVQRSMEAAADPSIAHSVKIDEFEWSMKWAMDWFDRMAYEQAGSLIRMMDGFLTTPVLTTALQSYIQVKQYSAAEQDDLFDQLNRFAQVTNKLPANLTMKDIMDTWTLKAGFPLVRVSRASSNRIYVSQEKFTNNVGAVGVGSPRNDELWHIPISIATQANPNFDPEAEQWLGKDVAMTSWEINADQWVILNAGATGFYRVLYDTPLTNLIKAQLDLDHNVINSLTRSQLMDDYFTSAYQRYINLDTALSLTSYLGKEDEIVVWNAVLKHLRKPLNLLGNGEQTSTYDSFKNYLLPKINSALDETGGLNANLGERAGMPILRHQQFVDWACALEDEACIKFAANHINQWKATGNNSIPRDIQQIVYCNAVAHGSQEIFTFIKQQYNDSTTSAVQRGRLLNALSCTQELGLINELLEGSITPGYFKSSSDGSATLSRLVTLPARSELIGFIRSNAEPIKDHFGSSSPLATVFTSLSTYVSTPIELQTLETVQREISEHLEEAHNRTITTALNTIRGNLGWVSDFGPSFASLTL